MTAGANGDVRVRPVEERDIPALIAMLREEFAGEIPAQAYRRLFDYRWEEEIPDRGFILDAGGSPVGYLGTIYSERGSGDSRIRVCNLTSWYVRPEYRGPRFGLALLLAVMQRQDQVVTSLSPNQASGPIYRRFGFETLSTGFTVFHPRIALEGGRGIRVVSRPDALAALLDGEPARLVRDHLPYGCSAVGVAGGGEKGMVIAKRRMTSGRYRLPLTEILHVTNPSLVRAALGPVCRTLLLRDRVVAVAADETIFGSETPPGWRRERLRLFLGTGVAPEQLDSLYSEMVLLGG